MIYRNITWKRNQRRSTDGSLLHVFAWQAKHLMSHVGKDKCLDNIMARGLVSVSEGKFSIRGIDESSESHTDSDYLVYWDTFVPCRVNPKTTIEWVTQKEFRKEFRRCGVVR